METIIAAVLGIALLRFAYRFMTGTKNYQQKKMKDEMKNLGFKNVEPDRYQDPLQP